MEKEIRELKFTIENQRAMAEENRREFTTAEKCLQKRIEESEKQVSAKRALWLDTHPEPTARREAMISVLDSPKTPTSRVPTTPSARKVTSDPYGLKSVAGFDHTIPRTSSTLQKDDTPRSNASGKSLLLNENTSTMTLVSHSPSPASGLDHSPAHTIKSSPRVFKTPRPSRSMFGGLGQVDEEGKSSRSPIDEAWLARANSRISASLSELSLNDGSLEAIEDRKFQEKSEDLIRSCIEWATKHCSSPNPDMDGNLAITSPTLWFFLLNLFFPNNKTDSKLRVDALLNDPENRHLLVARTVLGYIQKHIMGVESFEVYSNHIKDVIRNTRAELEKRRE